MKKTDNQKYKKKQLILKDVKILVRKMGWSKNILKDLTSSNLTNSDLVYLFPNGYIDILIFALDEINSSLDYNLRKIKIINLPLNKRIKKILMSRMEILNKDKIFYKKTFYHLLLPHNSKIMKKNLYKSVDTMWYLAGDSSTDFSFYTKRLILAAIYSNSLFILFKKDLKEVELNIDKNLYRVSKIPKIKDRFSFIKDNLPIVLRGLFN